MNILITGGSGYISVYTAALLAKHGHRISLYDNLTNSNEHVLTRLKHVFDKNITFTCGDIRDKELLTRVMTDEKIELVMHFAGLKKGCYKSSDYQSINVEGSFSVLDAMKNARIKKLVFSSSAAVYGIPQYIPIDESHPALPTNEYGQGKLAVENKLAQIAIEDHDWHILALRYFNIAGTNNSLTATDSLGSSSGNLVSTIVEVASGRLTHLDIWGADYNTGDGTIIRDYIHVMDVAEAHLATLSYISKLNGFKSMNIGSGQATSVRLLIEVFKTVSGTDIPVRIHSAPINDAFAVIANINLAEELLGWKPRRDIKEICLSEWRNRIS